MPTTAWILVSIVSGIVAYVGLYMAYVFLIPPWIIFALQMTQVRPGDSTLNTILGNLTNNINAAFVIIAVGIFFFMLISGYKDEPTSLSVDMY